MLINLKPADLAKEGSHYDLPLALGLLAAMDVLPRDEIAGYAALGELSLDGSLNPVAGVLPAAIGASAGDLGLICPASQGGEAAWAGDLDSGALAEQLSAELRSAELSTTWVCSSGDAFFGIAGTATSIWFCTCSTVASRRTTRSAKS